MEKKKVVIPGQSENIPTCVLKNKVTCTDKLPNRNYSSCEMAARPQSAGKITALEPRHGLLHRAIGICLLSNQNHGYSCSAAPPPG